VVPPEYPGRDPEQQQPEAQTVGRDRVRQPRIPVVHPPDQEQHHDDLHECCKTLAVDKDARQLRDREDEDEIEEELEGRDANAALSNGARRAALWHGRVQRQGTRKVEGRTTSRTEEHSLSCEIRQARVRRESEC